MTVLMTKTDARPPTGGAAMRVARLVQRLRELDLHDHARAIAQCWHIPLDDMFHSRRSPAPQARAALYRHLRDLGWSTPRIGALVGRDHTTIRHALRETPRKAPQ